MIASVLGTEALVSIMVSHLSLCSVLPHTILRTFFYYFSVTSTSEVPSESPSQVGSNSDAPSSTYSSSQVPSSTSSTPNSISSSSCDGCSSLSKGQCSNSNFCEWTGAANSGSCIELAKTADDACTSLNKGTCDSTPCYCEWIGSSSSGSCQDYGKRKHYNCTSRFLKAKYLQFSLRLGASVTTICDDDGCSSLSLGQCNQSNHCKWSGDSNSGTCTVNESPADDACTLYNKGTCEGAPCFCEWIGNGDGWCQNLRKSSYDFFFFAQFIAIIESQLYFDIS